jgi:hypothetical protein
MRASGIEWWFVSCGQRTANMPRVCCRVSGMSAMSTYAIVFCLDNPQFPTPHEACESVNHSVFIVGSSEEESSRFGSSPLRAAPSLSTGCEPTVSDAPSHAPSLIAPIVHSLCPTRILANTEMYPSSRGETSLSGRFT